MGRVGIFLLLTACAAPIQRATLVTVPVIVRDPSTPNEKRAVRIETSKFDVSASDSVTGSHRLHFEQWSGTFEPGTPERLTLDLDARTIVAETGWVTNIVRSDLLEAWRYPNIHLDVNVEGNHVAGNVTLHGITRAIEFDALCEGGRVKATFAMSRSAFDIHRHDRWDSVIDDDFRIEIDLDVGAQTR